MSVNGTHGRRRRTRSTVAVLLAAVAVGLYLYARNMGNSFVVDEWMFVGTRHDFAWDTLLAPHNGHLSVLPAAVYVACFKLFGLGHYEVFRILAILLQLSTCMAVGEVVRRKQGFRMAFIVAIFVAISGIGVQNSLWGFQIGFMGGVFYFVLAVLVYDRFGDQGDLLPRLSAMICLCLALGSSGTGLPGLCAFWLLIVSNRQIRRLWWIGFVPSLMYLLWSLKFGDSDALPTPSFQQMITFVIDGMSGSLSGLFGVDIMWGRMALGALLLVAVMDVRHQGFSARRHIWIGCALAFWFLTAFKRAALTTPLSSRYLWVGSMLLVMQIFEYLPPQRFRSWGPRKLFSIGFVVVLMGTWGSYPLLAEYRNFHRAWADQSLVRNTILLANRGSIAPASLAHSGVGIPLDTAEEFFDAVDRFGEPDSMSVEEILGSRDLRIEADRSMFELGLMKLDVAVSACEHGSPTLEFSVAEGEKITFRVSRPGTVELSRFLDIDDVLAENVRALDPGVYSIALSADDLGPVTHARFNEDVDVCE